MLIFILLGLAAMLAAAGIAIAILATKRMDGTVERPRATLTDAPKMARANGHED